VRTVNDIENLPEALRVDTELDEKGEPPVGARVEVMVNVVTPSSEELDASVGTGEGVGVGVGATDVELTEETGVEEFEAEDVGRGDALLVEPNPTAITGTADVDSEKRLVVVMVLCWSRASMIIFSQTDVPP